MAGIDRHLFALAAVLLCGAVPALVDATVVNLAVEALAKDLGASVASAQWVVTGYLLATTVGIPLVGWGLERFGARALWTFALALFAAGSALCGMAWSLGSLVVFRVAAGLGGGLVLPLLQAIMADAAGPLRVGRAMLLLTVPGQFVMILGPVFGGLVIELLGWRWTFFAQVPLCVAAAVLGWWRVPPGRRDGAARLDIAGFALLLPALAMLVYGLAGVRTEIAGDTITAAGAASSPGSRAVAVPPSLWALAGAALLAGFVLHALRNRGAPLLDLRLFARRSFSVAAALLFVTGLTMWAPLFLLPLFYQRVLGADALDAGVLLAPQALGMALGMAAAGRLADHAAAARPLIVVGTALAVVTTLPFALATRGVGDAALGAALLARGVRPRPGPRPADADPVPGRGPPIHRPRDEPRQRAPALWRRLRHGRPRRGAERATRCNGVGSAGRQCGRRRCGVRPHVLVGRRVHRARVGPGGAAPAVRRATEPEHPYPYTPTLRFAQCCASP